MSKKLGQTRKERWIQVVLCRAFRSPKLLPINKISPLQDYYSTLATWETMFTEESKAEEHHSMKGQGSNLKGLRGKRMPLKAVIEGYHSHKRA